MLHGLRDSIIDRTALQIDGPDPENEVHKHTLTSDIELQQDLQLRWTRRLKQENDGSDSPWPTTPRRGSIARWHMAMDTNQFLDVRTIRRVEDEDGHEAPT